jgi:hypothetical protein
MGSTVVLGAFWGRIPNDTDDHTTLEFLLHPGDPAYAFPKLDEYTALLSN